MPIDPTKIKALRRARNLTQHQVALRAGMRQQHYSRLESGGRPNPSVNTLAAVAGALEVTVNDLLKDEKTVKIGQENLV